MTALREHGHDGTAAAPRRGRGGKPVGFVLRHPVLCVVALAFVLRAGLAVAISVVSGGSLFLDDGTYPALAAQHAFGDKDGWSYYEYFLFDATATLLLPLSWLYRGLGYSVLIGQLLVAAWAALAAGAATRLAMEALPRRWALGPGLVVALLPSQVLFSATVLKDAAVWALLACLALVVALLGRLSGWRAAALLVAAAGLYVLLAHLRLHTLVAAAWAAALAVLLAPGRGLLLQRAGMLGLTLLVPLALGIGAGGWTLVTDSTATLEERRLGNAVGAATAFVEPTPAAPPKGPAGAGAEPGRTPGSDRPGVQDPAEPAADADEGGLGGRTPAALARGLSVMLLEPYPVPSTFQNRNVTMALAENLVWWPLLALAVVGVAQVPRQRRVLAFPLLAAGAIVLLYALSEGNFGTAFRHRGEIVWAVGLLAAVGAHQLLARRSRRATS